MGKPQLPDDLDARREAFNASLIAMAEQLPHTDPGIATRDEDAITDCPKLRIYHPHNSSSGEGKLPCVVFCHGGGWLSGNLDTEDHMCRTICAGVGAVVVSVEYGIFPFVGFERMVEDCFAAFQYVRCMHFSQNRRKKPLTERGCQAWTNAIDLGADTTRFAICGGSAGAALAVAVVYRLIAAGQGDRVAGLVSMQGLFTLPSKLPGNYRQLHTSYEDNSGPLPIVSGEDMKMALENVAGEKALSDVSLFPIHSAPESLKEFPRTYIINTDKEALRDDGTVLEAALKDLGVAVKKDIMVGLPHYFWCFPVKKRGQEFRDLLVQGVKWVLFPENAE